MLLSFVILPKFTLMGRGIVVKTFPIVEFNTEKELRLRVINDLIFTERF